MSMAIRLVGGGNIVMLAASPNSAFENLFVY